MPLRHLLEMFVQIFIRHLDLFLVGNSIQQQKAFDTALGLIAPAFANRILVNILVGASLLSLIRLDHPIEIILDHTIGNLKRIPLNQRIDQILLNALANHLIVLRLHLIANLRFELVQRRHAADILSQIIIQLGQLALAYFFRHHAKHHGLFFRFFVAILVIFLIRLILNGPRNRNLTGLTGRNTHQLFCQFSRLVVFRLKQPNRLIFRPVIGHGTAVLIELFDIGKNHVVQIGSALDDLLGRTLLLHITQPTVNMLVFNRKHGPRHLQLLIGLHGYLWTDIDRSLEHQRLSLFKTDIINTRLGNGLNTFGFARLPVKLLDHLLDNLALDGRPKLPFDNAQGNFTLAKTRQIKGLAVFPVSVIETLIHIFGRGLNLQCSTPRPRPGHLHIHRVG